MRALDRLRALETSRKAPDPEPTKPTEGGFDGFVGAAPTPFPNNFGATNETVDALTNTARDVQARYPGAVVEPLPDVDRDVERRREKALAMLEADPNLRVAVVAERPDLGSSVALVCVAVRDAAVADLEIPAERYDGFALLGLMQLHGHA